MNNLYNQFNSFFYLCKDFIVTSKRIRTKFKPRKLEEFSEIKIFDDQLRKLEISLDDIVTFLFYLGFNFRGKRFHETH